MKNKSLIIGGVVVVVVIIILIAMSGSTTTNTNNDSTNNDNSTSETTTDSTNTTDMEVLKSSEYTSDAFGSVNIGDTKSTVEEAMGALEEVGVSESGYDVYSAADDSSTYYFFFEGDTLKEVSVVLNS